MPLVTYVLARFSEPSSYAGLGAALALLGWNLSDTTLGTLIQFSAGLCGLLALFIKDRGAIKMIALVVAVAPLLSACGGLVAMGSAAGAAAGALALANAVSGTVDTAIQTACSDYETGKAAANAVVATGLVPASIAAKIASIEGFGDAACANPPAGDALSTAVWLGQLVGQIATLTSGAKAGGGGVNDARPPPPRRRAPLIPPLPAGIVRATGGGGTCGVRRDWRWRLAC